tara:strand:+ start:77 stop:1690 length:1614 start_codon:yes stop_codon:yes gene_type:complete
MSLVTQNPPQFEEWQVKHYNEIFDRRFLSKEDVVFLVGILKECTSGATYNLKRSLRSTNVQMTAVNVMRTIAKTYKEHCETIHANGGIQALVALTSSDPSTAVSATCILGEIVPYDYTCRQTFLACSGLQGILNQLTGNLEQVRMGAAALVCMMQGGRDDTQVTKDLTRQLGGIEKIMQVLNRDYKDDDEEFSINVICNAVGALGATGTRNAMNQNYIRDVGGIAKMVYVLATYVKDGSSRISKNATTALGNLIARNLPNKAIVCSLNAHHHLLTLLIQSAEISKEKGTLADGTDEILHVITNLNTEARMMDAIIDKDKDGIGALLQLLPLSINTTKFQFVHFAIVRILSSCLKFKESEVLVQLAERCAWNASDVLTKTICAAAERRLSDAEFEQYPHKVEEAIRLCDAFGVAVPNEVRARLITKRELDKLGCLVPLPNEFFCPLTLEIMKDPVVASDGFTYERNAIERVMMRDQMRKLARSPMTQSELEPVLFPNRALLKRIREFEEDMLKAAKSAFKLGQEQGGAGTKSRKRVRS